LKQKCSIIILFSYFDLISF